MGSFAAAHRLFAAAHGLLSSCGTQAPEHAGSVVAVRGLSCPAAHSILVSRRGIKPGSPALEGGFLTTGPPGKSLHNLKTSLGTSLVVQWLRLCASNAGGAR